MKTIPFTNSDKVALVDDDDYERLSLKRWQTNPRSGYAYRCQRINGKSRLFFIHREVMPPPDGFEVDHINHNRLDNRKSNLRWVTHQQNTQNVSKRPNVSSKFKGVSFYKRDQKWSAYICTGQTKIHLGYFESEVEAARRYNEEARKVFGEFAHLNPV